MYPIRIFFIFLLILSINSNAATKVLLDKIVGVIDHHIITLSQVKRVEQNLHARSRISNIIYTKEKYSQKELTQLLIERKLIRDKLEEIGYIVTDDQVELQIKETEKSLGVSRSYLLDFLSSNNLTFDEYFELIRETIEFNIFSSRVIVPLVSVSEQEIKNRFYKENINNQTLSFKYTLADFYLEDKDTTDSMLKNFQNIMRNFQNSGTLPNEFKNIQTNVITDVNEDTLREDLRKILKQTDEGEFTPPIKIKSQYHVFFVKSKNLTESELFNEAKERIRFQLTQEVTEKISNLWFEREINGHYVKFFN